MIRIAALFVIAAVAVPGSVAAQDGARFAQLQACRQEAFRAHGSGKAGGGRSPNPAQMQVMRQYVRDCMQRAGMQVRPR